MNCKLLSQRKNSTAGLAPVILFFLCSFCGLAPAQTPVRFAVLDLSGDEKGVISSLLKSRASGDSFELIDDDLARTASRGAGYDGGLNLSRGEARALGQSLGCDFFMIGKVQNVRRAGPGDDYYFEALAGLFFVETRSGRLIRFAFESAKDKTETQAQAILIESIEKNWGKYSAEILAAREKQLVEIENFSPPEESIIELISDETATEGTQSPVFYQRIKPVYTEQADLAGITATVELEAVFGDDGRVGEVEVTRWAGFGLDEAAITAVRQIRYKPAQRAGKTLTIRGLVRYNFRRPHAQAARPSAQSREELEEIEKLKRSLRRIQIPDPTSGQMPKETPGRRQKQNPQL